MANAWNEVIKCECGMSITRSNMPRHKKSENHIKNTDRKLYKKLITRKYDKKIQKIIDERDAELAKLDKKIRKSML